MKKYLLISLIVICTTLLTVSVIVNAQEQPTIVGEDNFLVQLLKNLQYKFSKIGLFTAEGQDRKCALGLPNTGTETQKGVNALGEQIGFMEFGLGTCSTSGTCTSGRCSTSQGTLKYTITTSVCPSGTGLINVFTSNPWGFIGEFRDTTNIAHPYGLCSNSGLYIEIYCCPYLACSSNSGCSSPPASNYGSTCNPTYGSCYGTIPTHTTEVYKCVNGVWTSQSPVSYGNSLWCSSSTDKHYVPSGSTSGGCYSSPPSGWCVACTPDNSCAANTCTGQTCVNNCGTTIQGTKTCQTCTNPSNWVTAYAECCGTKPFGCTDKRCVATENECGTCGCQETACTSDSNCCQTPQCGLNQYMKLSCISGKCQQGCQNGYTKCSDGSCKTDCSGIGDIPVGSNCEKDNDCESFHCDKSHWYSLSQTCQPIPWDEVQRISMTREQISDSTNQELISIACIRNNQCLSPGVNFTVKCIPLSKLKEEGTIIDTQGFLSKGIDIISSGATGGAIGGIIGGVVCAGSIGATVILAPTVAGSVIFGTVAATACSALITGGAIIGATQGIKGGISATEKDPIVIALKAGDTSSVGLCVAEQPASYCKYTSWAGFFKITGDKCTDGLIIIIAGLFLLILLFRR